MLPVAVCSVCPTQASEVVTTCNINSKGDRSEEHIDLLLYRLLPFLLLFLSSLTDLLAKWLRCLPRDWKFPGSNPAYSGIFPGSSHTSDLKIGTPVAILPGVWHDRVSAGTGWPDVSIP